MRVCFFLTGNKNELDERVVPTYFLRRSFRDEIFIDSFKNHVKL